MDYNIETISQQPKRRFLPSPREHRPLLNGPTDLNQMLEIVEDTSSTRNDDVIMRILTLEKLICQNQLDQADSRALKIYAMDKEKLYGRPIQCAAMIELTNRTLKTRFSGN